MFLILQEYIYVLTYFSVVGNARIIFADKASKPVIPVADSMMTYI